MYLNDFSVRVAGGNEIPGGYVEMVHGQTFQIVLRNGNNRRCDARVELNGSLVGTWRLNAHSSATLERPANGDGKFTFYLTGSSEAYAVQPEGGRQEEGLVVVTFTPELVKEFLEFSEPVATASVPNFRYGEKGINEHTTMSYNTGAERGSYHAGVIGQSGHSSQQYGTASEIEYDYAGQTVITLRLVSRNNDGPRPLTQRANPIPPAVR